MFQRLESEGALHGGKEERKGKQGRVVDMNMIEVHCYVYENIIMKPIIL
jgi:hypothetical protein